MSRSAIAARQLVMIAALAGVAGAAHGQTRPYFANGEVHCPDGSSAVFRGMGESPSAESLNQACLAKAMLEARDAQSAAATAAQTETRGAPDADPMSSLAQRMPTLNGEVRCPDGTTRPFEGENPSELVISMACSVPADVAAERRRQAKIAETVKNENANLEAALNGEAGFWAGVKATFATGRLDFLLGSPFVWLIGAIAAYALFGRLLVRLFTSGR